MIIKKLFTFMLFSLMCTWLISGAYGSEVSIGHKAPEIKAQSWLNSEPLSLAKLRGKVVVVEFWATWCPPCRQSIPHLSKLYEAYKNRGVVLVSLTDQSVQEVEPFAKEMHMGYPVGVGSVTAGAYGVSSIPYAVVIGKNGKIAWEGHPLSDLDKAIESALR